MIPPYTHANIKSVAEKKIFQLIKNEAGLDGWVCLHSLGIARHMFKAEGEIDFILLGSGGLFCLEVKGGRVKRDAGFWFFTDRYGFITKKKESPFKQVASALYSLRENINREFGNSFNDCLFGYGVLFPDIEFSVESPEWDNQIVYDISDRLKPFGKYLKRLIGYWNDKLPGKRKFTNSEIDYLAGYLRKDFELIIPLNEKLEGLEKQIIQLTEEQYKALDRMENNKRVFFRGTAGTGKTLLALEKVRRTALNNKRVLLLCYNKILGGKLRYKTNRMENHHLITANSVHKYFYNIILSTSLQDQFLQVHDQFNGDTLYKKIYPQFFIRALNEIQETYDCLVIDEGQDLLCSEYFQALDYILKDGLEKGEWAIFYDSNNQGELYKNFDRTLVKQLTEFGAADYRLDINCRNTKQIAVQTSVVSGFNVENTRTEGGEKVQYYWFIDERDQINILVDIIKKLLSEGVKPGAITLLYPEKGFEDMIIDLKTFYDFEKVTHENAGELPENKITYSTAQGFKGMENKVIIYCGVKDIDGDKANTVNYVAMSRAGQLLILLLNSNLKQRYLEKNIEYLTKGRG
ncbi:nuclease-related domain-containing DEAD/DEAH box helicase [Desulforamulus hydrothermalis]|nr:NERD domain-containing protein [Desulforamulus hydrothermalis]